MVSPGPGLGDILWRGAHDSRLAENGCSSQSTPNSVAQHKFFFSFLVELQLFTIGGWTMMAINE